MGWKVGPSKARFQTVHTQLGMIRKYCDEIEDELPAEENWPQTADIERQVALILFYCDQIEEALAPFWSHE